MGRPTGSVAMRPSTRPVSATQCTRDRGKVLEQAGVYRIRALMEKKDVRHV